MAEDRELKATQAALDALKPLGPVEQQRALNWLASKLELEAPTVGEGQDDTRGEGDGGGVGGGAGTGALGTIKQFLTEKGPDNDVARATALAYYLTHGQGKETFTNDDLSKARTDAALPSFNVSRGRSNARTSGYLTTTARRGSLKITSLGESLVDAMPDKEAMKKVTAKRRKTRRKATGRKRASTKKRTTKKP